MPATTKKTRTVLRFLLICSMLALIVGIWYGLQRPQQLHITARYVLKAADEKGTRYPFQLNGRWLPTGLLRWSIPNTSRQPVKLAFDSWDGKTHWQVMAPAAQWPGRPRESSEIYRPPIEYSPNGHYVALLTTDGPHIRVMSWHDGKPDVAMQLPGVPGELETGYRLYIRDDGQIWIHSAFARACRLWCIDNRRIATGTYVTPFRPYTEDYFSFKMAPDGSVLVPAQIETFSDENISLYVSLDVRKDRIISTPRHKMKGPVTVHENGIISQRRDYYDAGGRIGENTARQRLRKREAELMVDYLFVQHLGVEKKRWIVPRESNTVTLPDGKAWSIITCRKPVPFSGGTGWSGRDEGACSADGQFLLMVEDQRPWASPRNLPMVARVPYVKDTLIRRLRPWRLSLYERPGKLRAGLTLTDVDPSRPKGEYRAKIGNEYYRISGWALSPDSRRIGLNAFREKTNQFEFLVCRW
ncbi:MAG: hypothetical protein ACYDCO_24620 [Armatimonadota bacterium]